MQPFSKLVSNIKTAKGALPDLGRVLKNRYDLDVEYGRFNQNAVVHVIRAEGTSEDSVLYPIQEEATLIVVDEQFNVIAKAPPKLYPMSYQFCPIKEISNNKPVSVLNMVDGQLVTVSKYGHTYLVSTKQHLHALNRIVPTGTISVNTIILDLLERANPYSGVDALFINRNGVDAENTCFSFILSPKEGVYTENADDYELHLVGMYNRNTESFSPYWEIAGFARYFNIASDYGIHVQHPVIAYNYDHVKVIAEARATLPNIKGIVLQSQDGKAGRAYYIPPTNSESKPAKKHIQCGPNYQRFVSKLSKPFLDNNYIGSIQAKHEHGEIATIIHRYLEENRMVMGRLYQEYRHSRTCRAFYLRVEHHPFRKALVGMYRGTIKTGHEFFRVINTSKFARELLKDPAYSDKLRQLIDNEMKEISDVQKQSTTD